MKQATAIQRLSQFEQQGRYVYSKHDLAKIFSEDSKRSLESGLGRLVKNNLLQHAARGVYVYVLSPRCKGPDTLELVARTLRRGAYSYVSLESALSEYGVISQIPTTLTMMTTGRAGEYVTPYGRLEFTHTKRDIADILPHLVEVGRPLKMASKFAALRDLKRVGRNLHLVNKKVLDESGYE